VCYVMTHWGYLFLKGLTGKSPSLCVMMWNVTLPLVKVKIGQKVNRSSIRYTSAHESSWITFLSEYCNQICHCISGEYDLRNIRSRQYMMREKSVSQTFFFFFCGFLLVPIETDGCPNQLNEYIIIYGCGRPF
jgi:hypothetical protein